MLRILLLLGSGVVRKCLAVQVTGDPAPANSRLIRNADLAVELDSAGRVAGKVPGASLAVTETNTGPAVSNGGFEEDDALSNKDNYQYVNRVPDWEKTGDVALIRSYVAECPDDTDGMCGKAFKAVASHGKYLLGLAGKGSAVYQSVSGHIPGNWYRLVFHSAYRAGKTEAKMKVSIGSSDKMNELVAAGTLGWFEVSYKAPFADVVIRFDHDGTDLTHNSVLYLDGVAIKPVQLWDTVQNGAMVLIQKVVCNANSYPSNQTCPRGKFITAGDFSDDGSTNIVESDVAKPDAVWVAIHKGGNRWAFKSDSLKQATGTATNTMWFLHSDYSACQAKNMFTTATSSYHVETNALGLHEVSDIGTACGTLFAIQKFQQSEYVGE